MPGRSTKEKGREEGLVDEDSGEKRISNEISQEVVAGIKEKVSVHDGIPDARIERRSKNWKSSWNEEGWKEAP